MKFCSKCGNQLDSTKKFCNKCGAPNAAYSDGTVITGPSNDDLRKLQLQKEEIERELERKAREEMKRKEELRLEEERIKKEAFEREQIERQNREREKEAAELKRRELDESTKQQQELRKKEQQIEEQSEILQKVKLERELLQRELDNIAALRLKREQVTREEAIKPAAPPVENKTGKRFLIAFTVVFLLAAVGIGGFYGYQKFVAQDYYQKAVSEINAHQWGGASQDLKKALDENSAIPGAKQRTQSELDNITLWQKGTTDIEIAIQYPGILLTGSRPAAKDYVNVLAKFRKIPFESLKANALAGVNTNTAFAPVYLLQDSIELGLMQTVLKDEAKLSLQKESLVYTEGYLQLNLDTLDAAVINKTDPLIMGWYNQLLETKSKVLETLAANQTAKPKVEPTVAYHAPKPKWEQPKTVKPKAEPAPEPTEAPKRSAD